MKQFTSGSRNLLVRSTDKFIIVDLVDWDNVKNVRWTEEDGCICTEDGTVYEDFIGLQRTVKNMYGNIYDKRREFFVGVDENWVYSEYTSKYELLPPEKT